MMKNIILLAAAGLVMVGCNPSEFFSQMSASDVERSASEAMKQSDIVQQKIDLIDAKKSAFPEFVELGLVDPELEAAGVAFRNDFDMDQKFLIEVEAILPDEDNTFYEAWLVSDDLSAPLSLGALTYNSLEDYSIQYESMDDLSSYHTVIITKETKADDEMEERLLIGQFKPDDSTEEIEESEEEVE